MRILVVSLNYSPEPTATGKYTGEMAAWLAEKGHEVTAIAAYPHYPQWDVFPGYKNKGFLVENLDGVKVNRVPCYIPKLERVTGKTRILMELSFTFLSLFYWLSIFFSRRRYSVVIAICPPMQTALFSLIYSKLRQVPFVFHVQDFQVDMAFRLGILKPRLFNRMLYKLESFLIRRASYLSTITRAMCDRAQKKGVDENKLIFFPNWADIDHIKPELRYNDFREGLGYDDADFVVLYSGGMGNKQGLEIIIDVAEKTCHLENVKYLIVGDGGAKSKLTNLAKERDIINMQFLPLQPFDKLPSLLALSDINLIVQRAEAADFVMPSKLSNILSAGRAVIATAGEETGLGSVIVKNRLGLITSPGDVSALAKAIESLMNDRRAVEAMGLAARAYAEKFLNKETILSQFERSLEKISRREHAK